MVSPSGAALTCEMGADDPAGVSCEVFAEGPVGPLDADRVGRDPAGIGGTERSSAAAACQGLNAPQMPAVSRIRRASRTRPCLPPTVVRMMIETLPPRLRAKTSMHGTAAYQGIDRSGWRNLAILRVMTSRRSIPNGRSAVPHANASVGQLPAPRRRLTAEDQRANYPARAFEGCLETLEDGAEHRQIGLVGHR